MKISGINIKKFAKDEYSNAAPAKTGINGRNLLIFGENRSGKTLTFNAILYCLLGSQETIDLSTGRGNRVSLSFDNDVSFARGHPKAELENDGDTLTGDQAKDKFSELLGDSKLIKSHFIHSHIDRLPLSRFRKQERLEQIRSVTNSERQQELNWNQHAQEHISSLLVDAQDTLRRIKEDRPDVSAQIASTQSQLKKHRTTQSLIESGQLERIREQLVRNEELDEELDKLFTEQEAIRQQLNRLKKRRRRHEGYSEEVLDIITEAVNDFVCPACNRRVSTKEAKDRLENGYCPYCRQKGSLREVKEHIGEKVERANEILNELKDEIDELEQRRDELNAETEAVKSQNPALSNLDAAIKRKLREHEYDVDRIADATEEEIQAAEETLETLREKEQALEEQIKSAEKRCSVLQKSHDLSEELIREIQDSSHEQEIQNFTETWTTNYRAMAGDLGFEIGVTRDGDVIVPGGTEDVDRRQYDRRGDLSDSELRLLNISYAYTLNEYTTESGAAKWRTFVLDEPFSALDETSSEVLLEFLLDSEQQFLITTSNHDVAEYFDDFHTITLTRGPIQTELGDFQ